MSSTELDLSPSVVEVLKLAGPEQPISAVGLAQIVFKLHPEYAGVRLFWNSGWETGFGPYHGAIAERLW